VHVVIIRNAEKLVQHFRDYFGNKSTEVTGVLQKTTQETEGQTPRKRKAEQMSLLDPTTEVYHIAFVILFSLLCLALCTGLV